MPRATKTDPRIARVRRDIALERAEVRGLSQQRVPSAGITSFAVKAQDPETRRLVDEFLARRNA